jgi:hypothetical protein
MFALEGTPPFAEAEKINVRQLGGPVERRDRVYPLACCAVVLGCMLLANPFANAGFNDDWSYSHVALKFAETGRIHYNGWGAPMLLVQTLWGAAWIRLFGFSFNILRLATLPFSLGFVWLVYGLARKSGLRRDLACFAALGVGTSPVFIPLAASFMTDAYGCFFITLCVYAFISCVQARGNRSRSRWLWTLAIAGIIGGSDRQIVWIAPLTLIPYVFWIRRFDRRFSWEALGAYGFCLISVCLLSFLFTPPYEPFDVSRQQAIGMVIGNSPVAVCRLISLFLMLLLVALPAFLCFTPLWKDLGFRQTFACVAACGTGVFCLSVLLGTKFVVPFLGNIVTQFGVLNIHYDALGPKPVMLPEPLRIGLTVLMAFSALGYYLLQKGRETHLERTTKMSFLIVSCGYTLLLFPGALVGLTFDRYVTPLTPMLIVLVLHRFQSYGMKIPRNAWACLFIFCVYGVVATHDYSSALRARVQVARRLEERGIPRRNISAGLEYDGWSHLQLEERISNTVYGDSFDGNRTDRFWLWHYTTALGPKYVAVNSLSPGQTGNNLFDVTYSAWTPPFRRAVVAIRREDLAKTNDCRSAQPCRQ